MGFLGPRRLNRGALAFALSITAMDSARTVDIELGRDAVTGQVAFDPANLRLQTGDKLRFAANGSDALVGTIAGMLPDGVAPQRQKPAQVLTVILDKDGVYGFGCLPHYRDGVVALYVASKPANEGAAKSVHHPAAAAHRLAQLFAVLDDGRRGRIPAETYFR